MLDNPYYIGIVRYAGVEYDGNHEPLIDPTHPPTSSSKPSSTSTHT